MSAWLLQVSHGALTQATARPGTWTWQVAGGEICDNMERYKNIYTILQSTMGSHFDLC